MKEDEEMGRTTRENSEQKETGASSSWPWASKFLGLPSKMGGWVMGKKTDEDSIDSNETGNHPLPLKDSPSLSQPSILIPVPPSSSSYEISEDEDEPNYMDLIDDNEIGGLADDLNMKYNINEYQRDTDKDENVDKEKNDVDKEKEDVDKEKKNVDTDKKVGDNEEKDVDKEKEDGKEEEDGNKQGELQNQLTDQSDSASTDSFASASSPPKNCNTDFTLVDIKQEPLDEEDIEEVDENGVKVKVVKFPVKQLEELFRCKKELQALKCMKTREEEKPITLHQASSHKAPVQLEGTTSSASASTSRRNPGRSAKKPNKKSVKTEKSPKKKSAIKGTKQRYSKKKRASSSSATAKEKKPNVDELSCVDCGRTFTTKSGLRNHELSHKRANGQYKCKVCEKDQFKTAHHLRQHEACHFPAETCNFCEKKFGTRSNLGNHQRTSKVCKAIRQNGLGQ